MKKAIFDEQTSRALMQWHKKAKKNQERSQHRRTQKFGRSPEDSVGHYPAAEAADQSSIETADNNSTSPKETANLITTVDVPGDNTTPNIQSGENDLLTGL